MSEREHDQWRQHYASPKGFRWWPCDSLVSWVGDRRFGSVLEAGAGNGANLWFLGEHADRVVGIDMYAETLKVATVYLDRRGVSNVELSVADVRSLPFGVGAFDLVVDCTVTQHLAWADHETVFREYRRVLKPGGWVWLYHLSRLSCAVITWERPNGHVLGDAVSVSLFPTVKRFCLPWPEDLARCVSFSGFTVRTVQGVTRHYPNQNRACFAINEDRAHYVSIGAEVM